MPDKKTVLTFLKSTGKRNSLVTLPLNLKEVPETIFFRKNSLASALVIREMKMLESSRAKRNFAAKLKPKWFSSGFAFFEEYYITLFFQVAQ